MMVGDIEDVMIDIKHGLYDFTNNGKCSGCGSCCSRYLPMSQKEINQIHRYINKHQIKQQKQICNILAKPTRDMTCPFLDLNKKNKKCTIYEVRPLVCREFLCTGKMKLSKELAFGDFEPVDLVEEFFKE
jgi:Fe-S-cluster containining protein